MILPPTPSQMHCGMQQPQYTGLVINLLTSLAKPLLCEASHKPFYPLISVVVRENESLRRKILEKDKQIQGSA